MSEDHTVPPGDSAMESLQGQFLVSMPQMDDPNFHQTVVLLCKHDMSGAVGIVINRLSHFSMGDIYNQLTIPVLDIENMEEPVLEGGPVSPELGLVIHSDEKPEWESSMPISKNLHLTSSRDILKAIAANQGPEKYSMSLGYAGWGPGQLEHEIQENVWFTTPFDQEILFSRNIENKWRSSARLIGIDLNHFSQDVGHA